VHEVHRRSALEWQIVRVGEDGLWVHHGWSIVIGALLEVQV
jgi:hypothetical protein